MKNKKQNNQKKKTKSKREDAMLAASLVSLVFVGVGLYGYLNKSFRKGQLVAVLSDSQALGVLVFCSLAAIFILVYTWKTSK